MSIIWNDFLLKLTLESGLMKKWMLCVVLLIGGLYPELYGQTINPGRSPDEKKIHSDLIVLKLKAPSATNGRMSVSSEERLDELREIVNFERAYQVFTNVPSSGARYATSSLENIYKLKFEEGTIIWKELSKLRHLDYIEYAEPFFRNELLLIPNDPEANPDAGGQDYLTVIRAYEGWQIEQSDSTMVVGIVDTGVNMNHEDLGNIAFNYKDPVNGVDDDGDGFIDNFHGWDIGNNDNDPTADDHPHGTHVTGIGSATANNFIGMAGVGFNSKYLPVNAWNSAYKSLMNEYEGIIYAANHGCKVINLSWGGAGNKSKYGQDVINYAVLEKNVVIVAAAGNTPKELDFYPASYDHVLSVGATDMQDNMASWATYSYFIDIMAPGQEIFSTKNDGTYEKSGGSSFAAPMVAGAAALVRSRFPAFSAQQIMEQLRVTSDDIYNVGSNMNYFGQMGRGRLNVQKALSDILTPSVRVSAFDYTGSHGDLVFPGDSVDLIMTFTNYLRNAENVTVTISNPSENVVWEVDQIHIDKLGEAQSYSNEDDPICFVVHPDVKPGERLLFRIDYIGNNYSDFQYIEIFVTPGYFNISDGNLTATISSDGDIGYDDLEFIHGDGISFGENHIATNTGLIISLDSAHTLDNVINDFEQVSRDQDFTSETSARLFDNSIATYDARSVFRPTDTTTSALDIKIEQKILAWDHTGDDGFLIFEYRIINTGDSALNGLNLGLFADWDLGAYQSNKAAWDTTDHFGYVLDKSSNNHFSGLALLTNQEHAYYSIDLESLNGNSSDISTVFGDREKHNFLSAQHPEASAGDMGAGNDVAHVIGARNMDLPPQKSAKVAIAMLASSSLNGLRSALGEAKLKYAEYLADPPLTETFFSCNGDSALVDPAGEIYEFYSDAEATLRIDSGYSFKTIPVFGEQIYYAVNLDSGYAGDTEKILVKPGNPTAGFEMNSDTLLINAGQSGNLGFENTSTLSHLWQWDFGNGYSSNVENPVAVYETPGLYRIKLIAANNYGCSDTTSNSLLVAIRLEPPSVEHQEICKGTSTVITADNTNQIEVFADAAQSTLIFAGSIFETGNLFSDTVFFVINAESRFRSEPTEVRISARHPQMGFDFDPDTTVLNEKYVLSIANTEGREDNISWYVDNQLLGNGKNVKYGYTMEPFEISQVKMDDHGCYDTLTKTVTPAYSEIPVLENVTLCKNSSYTIKPQNGRLFYFYDDPQLTNLLHKGNSFEIQHITADSEYFVTGADGLLESNSGSIMLKIDPVTAHIEATADTLNLMDENTVELRVNSAHAQNSYWLFRTGTFDTTSVINEVYESPGNYEYVLVARGNYNCYDTTSQTITVLNVTALDARKFSKFNIYPNPVTDWVTIEFDGAIEEATAFELVDVSGKRVRTFILDTSRSSCQINLGPFKDGIYFIKPVNNHIPSITKILKK
ncbi:MAG: S8 family serine peptidase [Cytophagales bacterium]|nr:S8 family serine peptidase [Cytophagales bacterium]